MTPGHGAAAETAASHMVARVPRAAAGHRVDKVLAALPGSDCDLADTVFVLEDREHLAGVVLLADLLRAGPDATLAELMRPACGVLPETDQEVVAHAALNTGLDAVAVVDLSIITIPALAPAESPSARQDLPYTCWCRAVVGWLTAWRGPPTVQAAWRPRTIHAFLRGALRRTR